MKNKIMIGNWGTAALVINAICARVFLNFPRPMFESAGSAAWIATIYVCLLVFIIFLIILRLYKNFPDKDLLDISEYVGGGIGRVFVGLIIELLLLFIASVIIREYTETIKIISFVTSPLSFIMIFYLVGIVVAAYLGLEAIVRFNAIVVPLVAVSFLVLILGVSKYYDLSNIFPILGTGTEGIFIRSFNKISTFGPLLYLYLIPPFIKSYPDFKKIGYTIVIFSSMVLFISSFVYGLVIPYPTNIEAVMPMYQLARLINYGRFFQRLESIFMFSWIITAYMYLSTILFFAVHTYRKTFKLEYHKPLILPFAVIIFALAILPPNLITAIQLETVYYNNAVWLVTVALTIIVLLAGNIKKSIMDKRQ